MASTSLAAARVAHQATLLAAGLILVLHGLEPEIAPSWRFISEYALGQFGWLSSAAFLAFGMAHFGLATALHRVMSGSWSGIVASALLVISAIGLIIAGVFTTDAVTTDPGAATMSGRLHNVGGAMGMAMPFAVALVTWQLVRDLSWRDARRALIVTAALALVGTIVSMVSLGILLSRSGGTFGPDVPVGWPHRFELATYALWFLTVARRSLAAGGEDSSDCRVTGKEHRIA